MAKAKTTPKTNKKVSKQERKANRTLTVLLVILGLVLCSYVIYIVVIYSLAPRGIDCMPPMSSEEQECLNNHKCFCRTY